MPLRKLQEIIIIYAQYFYMKARFRAISSSVEYPYEGPAFVFSRDGDHLELRDNTQKAFTLPGGEQIMTTIEHRGFKEPKSNQVNAAFFKFQRWVENVRKARGDHHAGYTGMMQRELDIIRGKLLPLTVVMLKAVAESYAIREADPETGQEHWSYMPCDLSCRDGLLESGEEVPAKTQIQVEELNDLLKENQKDIDSMREDEAQSAQPAPQNDFERTIRLLQEIVVDYSRETEAKRRELITMAGAPLQSTEPPLTFALENGKLTFHTTKAIAESAEGARGSTSRRNHGNSQKKRVREITDALLKFALYQRETEENSIGILLIKDKLFPLTAKILSCIAKSYDSAIQVGGIQLSSGDLCADEDLPPALSIKVEEANLIKNKLLRQMAAADPGKHADTQAFFQKQIFVPADFNFQSSFGDPAALKLKPSEVSAEQSVRQNVINVSAVADNSNGASILTEQRGEQPEILLESCELSDRPAKRARSRKSKKEQDPVGSERRKAVEAYIEEVFKKTGKRITKADFLRAAGYTHRSEFQRWQRNDTKTTEKANKRFSRVLKGKPHLS